jgi:hypothetical protein
VSNIDKPSLHTGLCKIKDFLRRTGVVDDVNDERNQDEIAAARPRIRPRSLTVLGVIVSVEALVMAGLTVWLGVETVVADPEYVVTAIAILVLAAIAALLLVFVAIGTFRMQAWTRSATLVWQIFQVVAAIAAFQGIIGSANVGWFLLIPAIAAVILLFTRSAVEATRR